MDLYGRRLARHATEQRRKVRRNKKQPWPKRPIDHLTLMHAAETLHILNKPVEVADSPKQQMIIGFVVEIDNRKPGCVVKGEQFDITSRFARDVCVNRL